MWHRPAVSKEIRQICWSLTIKKHLARNKKALKIWATCRDNSVTKRPLLAVVSLWPLICLKSPKQQRGEVRFYCPSMRKEDQAALAWWMGSNWESRAGIKELYPAIKRWCSQSSRTENILCFSALCVGVRVTEAMLSEWFIQVVQVATAWYKTIKRQANNTQFSLCTLM